MILAEVLGRDTTGGLKAEISLGAGLRDDAKLVGALQPSHGEELDGVSAHLLDHGDGGRHRDIGGLGHSRDSGPVVDAHETGRPRGAVDDGVDVAVVVAHVGTRPAHGAEGLVEVVRLDLLGHSRLRRATGWGCRRPGRPRGCPRARPCTSPCPRSRSGHPGSRRSGRRPRRASRRPRYSAGVVQASRQDIEAHAVVVVVDSSGHSVIPS